MSFESLDSLNSLPTICKMNSLEESPKQIPFETTYLQIVFIIILACLVFTLLKYSQEGDISTFTFGTSQINEMKKKYPTKNSIVNRLHNLIIYREGYVKWNRFIIISMFASLVLLYFLREEVKLSEFIIVSCFLFLCIDLPNRWGHAHISKGVIQEATQLYTYHSLLK